MRKYSSREIESPATTDELKAHLVEMLTAFDAFCKEHGLQYYLSGGTLLGAVRHRGFIPWDDDIDVNMPRPDCEKLMELSGGRIGSYILNPPNYSNTYHAYHWKLFDESMLIAKKRGEKIRKVYPAFMDIFPIDGLPDTEAKNKRHYRKIIFWKLLAESLWNKKKYTDARGVKKLAHGAAYFVARRIGIKRLFNRVIGVAKSIPFETAEHIGVMMTKVHTTEERVVKAEYLPVVEVSFEGRTFPAPAGYETYLRQLYGPDYMQLPPEEERTSRHALIPYHPVYADAAADGENAKNGADDTEARPKTKIAICGLIKSENLGELFIARSLEYLIRTECEKRNLPTDLQFVEVDLLGRKNKTVVASGSIQKRVQNYYNYSRHGILLEKVFIKLKRVEKHLKSQHARNFLYRVRHVIYTHGRNYRKRLYSYFDKKMRDCVFIVVDGAGLLEYSYNEYQEPLLLLSDYAQEHDLDIVYNAIGRAGAYDEKDYRSTILRRALRSERVKYISARDSLETVQRCAGDRHKVKLLADAAFWMKETYQLPMPEERKKIGIGLIRGNSLLGYNVDFGSEDWVSLFAGIAETLAARGYEYEFFTNGLPNDVKLGRKVLKKLGLPDSYLVQRPSKDTELYATIGRYAGLITCRMHSSIASFTLGIPTVILSWNDKVVKLMDIIGYPERAVTLDHFDPVFIVDRFEEALAEGVDDGKIDAMKARALESVTDYIDLIVNAVTAAAGNTSADTADADDADDPDDPDE